MDFLKLAAGRKLAGLCGTFIICLCIALAADGMIAGGRKDPRLYDLTPGETLALTDPMPKGTETLQDLSLRTDNPNIRLRLVETFSGFWLGGVLWRAEAALPADLAPGEFSVTMHYAQNGTETQPRQSFRLRVHKNQDEVRRADLSLVKRHTGLSPYLLAALGLPLAVIPMFASFRISRRIAQALQQANMAEVYRAMASPEGQRVFFTLPGAQDLAQGAAIDLLDERGERTIGTALVFAVKGQDVEAVVQDGGKVRPGVLARPAYDCAQPADEPSAN